MYLSKEDVMFFLNSSEVESICNSFMIRGKLVRYFESNYPESPLDFYKLEEMIRYFFGDGSEYAKSIIAELRIYAIGLLPHEYKLAFINSLKITY